MTHTYTLTIETPGDIEPEDRRRLKGAIGAITRLILSSDAPVAIDQHAGKD